MSAQSYTVSATPRTGALSRLRREGFIPAVLYGRGVAAQAVQVNTKALTLLWHKTGSTTLLTLDLEGKQHPVLIREVQVHPLRGDIMHVDFYQVDMKKAIEAEVPVVTTGEALAVKELGGILVQNINALTLEALPKDLPHEITVDIGSLKTFDDVIRVKDITLPSGVSLLHEADDVVALVQPPRSEEELEKLSEEVKEDVEAVEGVKKEEKPEEVAEGEAAAETKAE